jgi:hypothetical protein
VGEPITSISEQYSKTISCIYESDNIKYPSTLNRGSVLDVPSSKYSKQVVGIVVNVSIYYYPLKSKVNLNFLFDGS